MEIKELLIGQWVYGDLENCKIRKKTFIHTYTDDGKYHRQFEVDPATVGQYTGRTDVDGDKIFEGDFLSVLVFQPKGEYLPREVVIEWNEERASYIGVDIKDAEESWGIHWLKKSLIVGNRWDNPSLLKGGKK